MRIENKIVDVLAAAECEPVALAEKEVRCWRQRWRTVFEGAPRHTCHL